MNGWEALDALLSVDPRDVGCDEAMAAVAAYAEVVVAGGDPERTHPGVTVHLASCGPCAVDLAGLLAAIRAPGPDAGPAQRRASGWGSRPPGRRPGRART